MTLFERLTKKAQEHPQRLVLPESLEPRTLQAADRIIADKIADVIFIGNKSQTLAEAEKLGLKNLDKAEYHDPQDAAFTEKYAELFKELRKKKGITIEQARVPEKPLRLIERIFGQRSEPLPLSIEEKRPHLRAQSPFSDVESIPSGVEFIPSAQHPFPAQNPYHRHRSRTFRALFGQN